jgi:hypothetical protein
MFPNSFVKVPGIAWIIIGILCLLALDSANPLYTITSLLLIPFFIALLWRRGEPPVLLVGTLMQWLTITIKVFYADYLGKPFLELHRFKEQIDKTFILSLLGLIAFTIGAHLAVKHIQFKNKLQLFLKDIFSYDTRKTIYAYLLVAFFLPAIRLMAYVVPGLNQPLLKVVELKWSFFFLLFAILYLKKENVRIFYLILLFEVILGFTGYFSSFKEFLILTLVCFLTFNIRLNISQYLLIGIAGMVAFNLSVIWTYVKPAYRQYLSGGQQAQIVTVSSTEALYKLNDLIANMSEEDFDESIVGLVDRVSYIDFFSASVDYVPAFLPHQNGKIWSESVQHVLLPRLLFPSKAIIDDSEQTAKYTGLYISGRDTGTSISLGYMAESYIDFGEVYMFFPIFLLGYLIGLIYKYLITHAYNILWGKALVIPLYFSVNVNGFASIKIVGGLIMYFLVALLVNKYVFPIVDKALR